MTRGNKIQIALLAGATVLVAWQYLHHVRQTRQLASLEEQVWDKTQELETRKPVLDQLEQRQRVLLEEKNASEKSVVVPLLRERAAVASARAAAEAVTQGEKGRVYRKAMADSLDNPEQRELNRQLLRNEIKSANASLVKKLGLTPAQADQFRDLLVENQTQKNDRLAALLRESVTVADALQQRDAAGLELERQLRTLLGDAGYAQYDEGRQKSLTDDAEHNTKRVNGEIGSYAMDAQQSERWQAIIRAELSGLTIDDTDTFRTEKDWRQWIAGHQQNIFDQAKTFLTPEQITALEKVPDDDLVAMCKQHATKRKAFGLTSN